MSAISDKKRKYLLFNKDDNRPSSQKPCAFFASPDGCRNGSKCMFSHTIQSVPVTTHQVQPTVSHGNDKSSIQHASKASSSKADTVIKKQKYVPPASSSSSDSSDDSSDDDRKKKPPAAKSVAPVKATPAVAQEVKSYNTNNTSQSYAKPSQQQQPQQQYDNKIVNVEELQERLRSDFQEQLRQQQEAFMLQLKQLTDNQNNAAAAASNAVKDAENTRKKDDKNKNKKAVVQQAVVQQAPVKQTNNATTNNFNISNKSVNLTPVHQPQLNMQQSKSPDSDDDGKFLFNAVNLAIAGQLPLSPNPIKHIAATPSITGVSSYPPGFAPTMIATTITNRTVHDVAASSSMSSSSSIFVPNNSVMKILSTSGTEHATKGNKVARKTATTPIAKASSSAANDQRTQMMESSNVSSVSNAATSNIAPPQPIDMLNVDYTQLPWQSLVNITKDHSKFDKDYTFNQDYTWVEAKKWGAWCENLNLPPVIAIDCEMCQTTDPVTGINDNRALIRFSIVNGLNPAEVIVDALVIPSMPITDCRSSIHGISESHLQGITFTLRHAQALMMQICSDRTIIIGHSVSNDLKALHFSHTNVIDTSYLFSIDKEPNASAGVREISEQLLGVKLLEIHDSVQDARACLQLAVYVLVHGTPPLIIRNNSSNGNSAASLLIHRIPASCTFDNVKDMIISNTQIVPTKLLPITFSDTKEGSIGKTTAHFASAQHADLAFDTIPGPDRPDKSSKSQKRVYLKSGGYICVRKC